MSDTLKIDRALLERLAPENPCYAHNGTIMVCWFCGRDNGYDELRPSDHADNCVWVAARALLEAPRPAVTTLAAIQQSEVFAVDPERMTLIGNNSEGVRCMATITAGEWGQMQAWWGYVTNFRGEAEFEQLMLARRILDKRGEPVE